MPLYQGFGPLYFFSSCQRQEIISPFATVFNIIVNILHFHESVNIYNITQDITLTKTTPITGNFFKAAITATTLAIMPIHIFLSIYNIAYVMKNDRLMYLEISDTVPM